MPDRELKYEDLTPDQKEAYESWGTYKCFRCGETFKKRKVPYTDIPQWEEIGEFWSAEENKGVICHAQCGLDVGMELA